MEEERMSKLCTEPGNEINVVSLKEEIIKFYQNLGKDNDIHSTLSVLMDYFYYFNNTSVSINEVLQIICKNNREKIKDLSEMDNHHLLLNSVFLPKYSTSRALPLL